jgi:hypothetical protein
MPSYHGLLSPAEIGAMLELIKSLTTAPPRPPSSAPAGEMGRAPPSAGLSAAVQAGLPPPGLQPNPLPVGPIYVPLSRLQADAGAPHTPEPRP